MPLKGHQIIRRRNGNKFYDTPKMTKKVFRKFSGQNGNFFGSEKFPLKLVKLEGEKGPHYKFGMGPPMA